MIVDAVRPCPVCAGERVERLHYQRFVVPDGHPLSDGYHVVHCTGCGFVYADMSATQADFDAFYSGLSKYDDPLTSTGSGESLLDRDRLAISAAVLSEYLPSRDVRIVDIGCAGGGFLKALANLGYQRLAGIDPSAACARMTREKVGEGYQGWLGNLPAEAGQFDCVILSHVLEHVLDVPRALSNLSQLMNPSAILYVECPDAIRYADYLYAPFQDFNTEHINHFSRICLDHALALQGCRRLGGGERLLRPSSYTYTPSVYGIYRSGDGEPCGGKTADPDLRPAVLRYIERSSALLERIDEAIESALRDAPQLVVWGAGQLALKLLSETRLAQADVVAFVDSNPIHHGHRLRGAPILPPSKLGAFPQPVLVATLLHHREIVAAIGKLGVSNRIILLPESSAQGYAETHA